MISLWLILNLALVTGLVGWKWAAGLSVMMVGAYLLGRYKPAATSASRSRVN